MSSYSLFTSFLVWFGLLYLTEFGVHLIYHVMVLHCIEDFFQFNSWLALDWILIWLGLPCYWNFVDFTTECCDWEELIGIGLNRDAYGFAVRPQHLQRYREYANIYKVYPLSFLLYNSQLFFWLLRIWEKKSQFMFILF